MLIILKKFLTIFIVKEILNFKKRQITASLRFSTSLTLISASNQFLQQKFRVNAFLSGLISSLFLLIADKNSSKFVASLVFCRTIHFMTRSWLYDVKGKLRNSTTAKVIDKYGEFLVWIYSSFNTNILISLYPELMPRSYRNGLMAAAGHTVRLGPKYVEILAGMRVLVKGLVGNQDPSLKQPLAEPTKTFLKKNLDNPLASGLKDLVKILPDNAQHALLVCGAWHPHQDSCLTASLISVALLVFKINIKSYLMLNFLSLVSRLHKKKSLELAAFRKWILDSLRSCAMVSVYMGTISLATCVFRRGLQREYLLSYALAGVCGTPAIFVDKPGRLRELNTYCMSNLMSSWIISGYKAGILNYNRGFETAVITPAFGVLAWLVAERPDTIVGIMNLPFNYILKV